MSLRIKHFITLNCNDVQFQEIVKSIDNATINTMTDATISTYSDTWILYNFFANSDYKSMFFETVNSDPGAEIAFYLSTKYRDIEICVDSDGGYFGAYLYRCSCINGHELSSEQYGVCNYRIRVPDNLGYDQNWYETSAFIPERIRISRHDLDRVAEYVLREAIKLSEKQDAANCLTDDPEAFACALKEARESVVAYSQFFPLPEENSPADILRDSVYRDLTPSYNDDDDYEFPFSHS